MNKNRLLTRCLLLVCLGTLICQSALSAVQRLGPATILPTGIDDKSAAKPEKKIDTLVICPDLLREALDKWIDYRTQQGYQIMVQAPASKILSVPAYPYSVKAQISTAVTANPQLRHVLLVGDSFSAAGDLNNTVPTDYVFSKATVHFGGEPEIATDAPYADLDNDGVPDLSLGRISVDTPIELTRYIDRVIRYESAPAADWQSRANFIAGVGGFGQLIDGVVESVAKKVITEMMPRHVQASMTYGSWTSPYCPRPDRFSDVTIERFNEGCLFWTYIGHGSRRHLDYVHMPDRSYPILDEHSIKKINCRQGNPIAIFLSCYASSIDDRQDCIGEQMMNQANGPIAVIGSSRVATPSGLGLMSMCLLEEYYRSADDPATAGTLGEVFLNAKLELHSGQREFKGYRKLIKSVSNSLLPNHSFESECRDHVQLLQLLGDPLLQLKRPRPIDVLATIEDNKTVRVAGDIPLQSDDDTGTLASVLIKISYQRNRLKHRFRRRRNYVASEQTFEKFQQTYEQSRDLEWIRQTVEVGDQGHFETQLKLPPGVRGACVVTCTMASDDQYYAGSQKIEISRSLDSD